MNIWNNNKIWEREDGLVFLYMIIGGIVLVSIGVGLIMDDGLSLLLHILGVVSVVASIVVFVLLIHFFIQSSRWSEKERIREEEEKKKAEEEKQRRKLEETRCPKCKKLEAIRSRNSLIDERLVSVRNVPEGNHLYEVEDYEERYLTIKECVFCDYTDEYTSIRRHSSTVKMIY